MPEGRDLANPLTAGDCPADCRAWASSVASWVDLEPLTLTTTLEPLDAACVGVHRQDGGRRGATVSLVVEAVPPERIVERELTSPHTATS